MVGIHAIGGWPGSARPRSRCTSRTAGGPVPRRADPPAAARAHPSKTPVDPADALASLLLTIGVLAGQIPPGLEARTALWRDRLAGRQLLLVLDDAASSGQVWPPLPVVGGSLVLVTSRRHLSALEDATTVSLDTLPPGQAAALLVRLAGRAQRRGSGGGRADRAVRVLAAGAIGMVARQLHHHSAWTTAGRAAELAAAQDGLELMTTENLSVAAAFNLSYADLAPGAAAAVPAAVAAPGDPTSTATPPPWTAPT